MNSYRKNNKKEKLLFLFLFVLMAPDFLYYTLSVNNFSLATILSIVMTSFVLFKEKVSSNAIILILLIGGIIVINVIVTTSAFDAAKFSLKSIASIAALMLLILVAELVASKINASSGILLQKGLEIIFYTLLIIGVVSALLFHLDVITKKSMIVFSEPSAFALIFTPVFIFFISMKKGGVAFLYISIAMLIALLVQNLTMIVGIMVGILVTKNFKARYVILSLLLVILLFQFNGVQDKLNYFSERVDFTNTTNFSVLVYLSGIERAYLNLVHSYGVGIGFQQMGINGFEGVNQHILDQLGAGNLNIFDGSFIASKLISEMGILGCFLIAFYLITMFKKIFIFKCSNKSDIHEVFYFSFYISFFVPLFVRGAGYINPYVFMYFVSVFGFLKLKKLDSNF